MFNRIISPEQHKRAAEFDRIQKHIGDTLAHPDMVRSLGETVVKELVQINDGAFLPRIKDGRAEVPRKHRDSDALALIPVTPEERKNSLQIATPLLLKPVRDYGAAPLELRDLLPYMPFDDFTAELARSIGAGDTATAPNTKIAAHGVALTMTASRPRGISRPVTMMTTGRTPNEHAISGVHELLHVSDMLRQPTYTRPGSAQDHQRLVGYENRGYYASAAATHALGVVPANQLEDTSVLLNTMRHYDPGANPEAPFAATPMTSQMHHR